MDHIFCRGEFLLQQLCKQPASEKLTLDNVSLGISSRFFLIFHINNRLQEEVSFGVSHQMQAVLLFRQQAIT